MRGPKAVLIEPAADEGAEVEARASRRRTPRSDAMRAALVLLAASGMANLAIAKRLDRAQPLLPMRPGQVERHTDDYKRHGTTSLFAALDVKAGTIISKCISRHRARAFRKFLDSVEQNMAAHYDIHLIIDNASSHKTKLIRDWFAKRPRWQMHFTPTSASWINQVECFFAFLTDQQIRRGAHRSTTPLEAAIATYITARHADPMPFRWTKITDDILASIARFCRRNLDVQAQRA